MSNDIYAKITGIYLITSPSNKVYVGQSVDIERRWACYKKNQEAPPYHSKLYSSLKCHGYENHEFRILKECSVEELNYWERYYQDEFDVLGSLGLNHKLTETGDKSGKLDEETKKKIAESNTGQKRSEETIQRIRDSHLGYIQTEEHRINIGLKSKGNNYRCGKKLSAEHIESIRNSVLGNTPKNKGSKWITNGIETIYLENDKQLPDGYWYGRTFRNNKLKKQK
jgi:group I intron endonuclease